MTRPSAVVVAGYFPPPHTGQALATERLADLLGDAGPVVRVSLQPTGGLGTVAARADAPGARLRAYVTAARRWRAALGAPGARAVLWASVSGQPLGHLRDVLLVLPALPRGVPVVGVVHWGRFAALHRLPWLRPSLRALVRRLDGLVFLDATLAEACAAFVPPPKRLVVPNTLDPAFLAAAAGPRDAPAGPWRLLFVSNMLAEKGWEAALEAGALLRRDGHDVRLTFAGGWPSDAERHAFAAACARLGLGPYAEHLGAVHDRAALARLYRSHDLLLLPTRLAEAQPLVVLEALACGTPVVTTRQGGLAGMLDDGVEGCFVDTPAPEALARAAADLRATPARWAAASDAARARFADRYAPDAVRARWHAVLDGLPLRS